MIDLVKALRSRATWETATGITEPSEHIDWMAADEITSLRGQVEALSAERDRLWADKLKMQGEITRLREEESSKLKVRTSILNALREENAELKKAVGLMTTMVPSVEIDANDPVGMAQKVCAEQARLSGKITLLHEAIDANYDYINLLKSDKTLQRIINQKIQSENDRLREALEPFVPETQWIDPDIPDTRPIDVMVLAGELRAARAAIRESSEPASQ